MDQRKRRLFLQLAKIAEKNETWLQELRNPDLKYEQVKDSHIATFLFKNMALLPKDGLDQFKGWIRRQAHPFPQILQALDDSKRAAQERAVAKREFVTRLALNPNSPRCREWVEKRSKDIPTYSVAALAAEYPP